MVKKLVLLFCLFIFLVGCRNNQVFSDYQSVEKTGWHKKKKLVFVYQNGKEDQTVDIYLGFRHNENYPYSNLNLRSEVSQNGKILTQETLVDIPLAEPDGTWIGKGMGRIKEIKVPFKQKVELKSNGKYIFALWQAMRTDTLKGVEDMSLMIEKSK
ncbi:MAG: gliding motility lipoprotein GldH [Flavobacteriaceae bacterium]|nr:MAG: gliding motility lipoprotein GldH [Flavobacteriaceae bacterium]